MAFWPSPEVNLPEERPWRAPAKGSRSHLASSEHETETGLGSQDLPEALLGPALSETADHVLQPLRQGFIPEGVIHGPKPFPEMIAIQVTEVCCLGF